MEETEITKKNTDFYNAQALMISRVITVYTKSKYSGELRFE